MKVETRTPTQTPGPSPRASPSPDLFVLPLPLSSSFLVHRPPPPLVIEDRHARPTARAGRGQARRAGAVTSGSRGAGAASTLRDDGAVEGAEDALHLGVVAGLVLLDGPRCGDHGQAVDRLHP